MRLWPHTLRRSFFGRRPHRQSTCCCSWCLILINAFFAATETAVVSLNENKIKKQAESGDAKAVQLLKMVESPTKFLSTIQVCITLSGFLASAFAADRFASDDGAGAA